MELFDYQMGGTNFLVKRDVALLADEPGLGKTPQAIRSARRKHGTDTVYIAVVTTKASIENWKREWARWWPDFTGVVQMFQYDAMSYEDSLGFLEFSGGSWDGIIADEAHKLKNPASKRTKNFYSTVFNLKKALGTWVWLLTGTPSKNHPGELYPHLAILRPDLIRHPRAGRVMAQTEFENRYCEVDEGMHGRTIRGANKERLPELRNMLKGFMLRRLKKDVQKDMPPLIMDTFPLTLDPLDYRNFPPMPRPGTTDSEIWDAMHLTPHASTERQLLGTLKAPYAAAWAHEELEAPGKMILFAHHRECMDILESLLGAFKPARVDGRTKDAQGQVDIFQNDPKCRVFLGQITACGEALNITAANQVAFVEASWSPSDNYQAACRAHRIGMQNGLMVRFLFAPGTMDQAVQRVTMRKTAEIAQLYD